jgi:hypothetical protein
MFINIQCFRAALVSVILPLLPVLVFATSAIAIAAPAEAQGAVQTAPGSQAGSGYWTPERMQSAKPAMPTVPGTPQSGSWTSAPSGPSGGVPAQGPTVPPQSSGAAQDTGQPH